MSVAEINALSQIHQPLVNYDSFQDPGMQNGDVKPFTNCSNPDLISSSQNRSIHSPIREGNPSNPNQHKDNKLSNILPPDECWLYKPPKFQLQDNETVKPITDWLRDTFDSPQSRFYHSRRNLLDRLEIILQGGETAAYRYGGSVPSLNVMSSMQNSTPYEHLNQSSLDNSTVRPLVYQPSTGSSDSLSTTGVRLDVNVKNGDPQTNMGTFTRTKRLRPSLPPQNSMQRLVNGSHGSTSHLSNSVVGNPFFPRSSNKTGSCDELEHADVQQIARIQEDNLKAEVAALVAASTAGRHGSQHSISSLNRNSPDGSCTNIASAPESPHSSTTRLSFNQPNLVKYPAESRLPGSSELNIRYSNDQYQGLHAGDLSQQCIGSVHHTQPDPNLSQFNHFGSYQNNIPSKPNPYKLLPQKPFVTTVTDSSRVTPLNFDQSQITASPYQNSLPNSNSTPISTSIPQSHFGFRPPRKISAPVLPKPPLPNNLSHRFS